MPSIQTTDTTHRNANRVLVLTSIASVMVALDALVVSTALSTIRLHLHASLAGLEWIVNASALSLAVLLMTGAALGDRLAGAAVMMPLALALLSAAFPRPFSAGNVSMFLL
jgi:MFS family permease